jgi:transcriptional regulator of PTS gene
MVYHGFADLKETGLTGIALKDQKRKKNILRHFSEKGESTIPELADLLNISVPKATEVIAELLKEGLLVDTKRKTDGPGRKAAIYSLNPDSCYFLGIEIRKYEINIALMNFNAGIVESALNIPFTYLEITESTNEISKEIKKFLSKKNIYKEKIIAMGLSLSGRINVKTSNILSNYHFGNAPLKATLEKEFGLPVFLDNDSRTLSYGEYYFGNEGFPYHEKNVCVVNMDYGMAIGIFINGLPVYGTSGYAGEIGHIPMFDTEKICFCGKKGCLETEASGMALIDLINKKINEGSSSHLEQIITQKSYLELEDIIEVVNMGDNLALEAVREIANNLGRGLAVAINMLNPELIILSGMLSELGEPLLLPVKTSIMQYSLALVNSDTRITLSGIGAKAGLHGCCLLVRDKVLGLV